MGATFEISLLKRNKDPEPLGSMDESAVTFNRYNKGLLIAAGRLHHNSIQASMFMKFAAKFRNLARLKFRSPEKTYFGHFCFINFIPETNTVVFGSVGPVVEMETEECDKLDVDVEGNIIPKLEDEDLAQLTPSAH